MSNPEPVNPELAKPEPVNPELTDLEQTALEAKLERVYSLGLILGVIGLAVGLFVQPVLWFGIAALVLVPLTSAGLMLLETRRKKWPNITRSILIALTGLLLAVLIGVLLPRQR
jgi:ABC-type Fe3+ transport system permease subunit